MRKLNVIENSDNYEVWFETIDGVKLDIPYYFLNRIDLENLVLYKNDETVQFPTLNELVADNKLICKRCYVEVDLSYKTFKSKISIKRIQKYFKSNGFNVTEEAIKHNFNAYLLDMKSGFRDEKNGYHLFTPCCHNPLSFRLTSLNKNCNWQTTYTA